MDGLIPYEGSLARRGSPEEIDVKLISDWVHEKGDKTKRAYLADVTKFYQLVQKPLQDVHVSDFHDFIDSLSHLSPSSRNRAKAAIKSLLTYGYRTGYLRFNVGTVVQIKKPEDKLAERIMSEKAVSRMFALEEDKRNHAILVLLYRAGLRVSELCDLQWRNLQERGDTGQVTVFGKGEKTRPVLLDRDTWEEVMSLQGDAYELDDYVFQSRQSHSRTDKDSNRLDPSTVSKIVREAATRAGVKGNVSPHWLRHAHATHALESGAPINLVKETLGHKSVETTSRYTHVRPNTSSTTYLNV